ncbi:histidine kinase [Actinosynnema sp. NPDC020468]|uniref:histidine kinase n=1 Tax=Actinosynnema sp. NPDC020468 TaxID=3154488 RepID=UPI0033C39344
MELVLLDTFKVVHWMNARKFTGDELAARLGVDGTALAELLSADTCTVSEDLAQLLAKALDVDTGQLAGDERRETVVIRTAAEMRATRRAVRRDGAHFYNYYTMAAPRGKVAPVILDVLCPADRLPALNNGHLEPAITVNLGPGDINGRWGEQLTDATWRRMRANRGADPWVTGDSYVEPSYCPHTYALATDEPARIISYTGESGLAPLIGESNLWPDHAFEALLAAVADGGPGAVLAATAARRGYDEAALAAAAGVPQARATELLRGRAEPDLAEARAFGRVLATDYRVLLPAPREHDEVGKTFCSVEQSRADARDFRGYRVAPLAGAGHLPDLTGLYVRVDGDAARLDLSEFGETHYLVRGGAVTLRWRRADGGVSAAELTEDDSAWVAPFVAHGWSGRGDLVKLGSGRHLSSVDFLELSNTFRPGTALRRGRRDRLGWGYDPSAVR